MSAMIMRWCSPLPNVYRFKGRPSVEYPMMTGSCSCNSDTGVAVEPRLVGMDVGLGFAVAVGGWEVRVAWSGKFIDSKASNRGPVGEVPVGEGTTRNEPSEN